VPEGETFLVELEASRPAWLDEILDALVEDRFVSILDTFITSKCAPFLSPGSEGFTLEQTSIHQSYQRVYESRIESYLKRHGVSQEQFMAELVATDGDRNALINSLVVVQDFEAFAKMMLQRALEQ